MFLKEEIKGILSSSQLSAKFLKSQQYFANIFHAQEHPEKITCPTCHTDCQLGQAGVPGLLPDYGVSGVHDSQLDGAYCTGQLSSITRLKV